MKLFDYFQRGREHKSVVAKQEVQFVRFSRWKKTADNVAKLMGLQTVRGVQNISHLRAAGREARWFARRSTLSNFHLCGIDQDGASLKGPLSAVFNSNQGLVSS